MRHDARRALIVTALLAGGLSLYCAPAFAYIDPNAGSIVFQIFAPVATMAMAGFFFVRDRLKRGWQWMCRRLMKLAGRE